MFLETSVETLHGTNGRAHYILQLSRTRLSTDSCRRGTDAVAMIQKVLCVLPQNVGITLDERGRVPVNERLGSLVPVPRQLGRDREQRSISVAV